MQLIARQKKSETGRYKGRVQTHLIANGKVIYTIKAGQKQPKNGQKTLMLNNLKYTLQWVT